MTVAADSWWLLCKMAPQDAGHIAEMALPIPDRRPRIVAVPDAVGGSARVGEAAKQVRYKSSTPLTQRPTHITPEPLVPHPTRTGGGSGSSLPVTTRAQRSGSWGQAAMDW